MEKSSIAGHTGGGGNEPQGRQGFLSKIPFFKFFTKLKFSVSDVNKYYVGVKPQPTLISVSSCRRSIVMHGLRPHSPRRVAFTLAEVLITLGIIGVVAALTMPTLLQKVESEVIKNQFKKVYSMLSQVYVKAEADLGYKPSCFYADDSSADYTMEMDDCNDLLNAVEKNLVILKKCENNALRDGCLPKSSYAGIENALQDTNPDISDDELNFWLANCGGLNKSNIENNTRTLVLKDGVILMFYSDGGRISYPHLVSVDVNGAKGPNKWGYDVFSFAVKSKAGRSLKLMGMGSASSCAPVEKGGMSSAEFIKNLYK